MIDLISRTAAIDVLKRKKDKNAKGDVGGFYNKIIQNDIDALIQLPSARPEQKMGKWISNSPITMRCNQCTYVASDWIVHEFHYCPNCGAKMEEVNDE